MNPTPRTRRRRPLEVEPLESMTLLSGFTTQLAGPPAAPAITAAAARVSARLEMTAFGHYAAVKSFPDIGPTYDFSTVAFTPGLGLTGIVGSITLPGFVASGRATGTLTLYSARGTVVLKVTGPLQTGFSPLPTNFAWTVAASSGPIGNVHGSGTLSVFLNPSNPTPTNGAPVFGTTLLAFHEAKHLA